MKWLSMRYIWLRCAYYLLSKEFEATREYAFRQGFGQGYSKRMEEDKQHLIDTGQRTYHPIEERLH